MKKMYDMEEFLSKNGSVTILLFCFLLTLNIVSHILGFWKSYYEYSRKKEEGVIVAARGHCSEQSSPSLS